MKKKVIQTLIFFSIDLAALVAIHYQMFTNGFPAVANAGYPGATIALVLMLILASIGIGFHFLAYTYKTWKQGFMLL